MSAFKLSDTAQSQLISTAELAKIISYRPQTIRKWLCEDKLPEGLPRPKKINTRHYWLRSEVADFISTFSVRESL